jgi:hypothetical protein
MILLILTHVCRFFVNLAKYFDANVDGNERKLSFFIFNNNSTMKKNGISQTSSSARTSPVHQLYTNKDKSCWISKRKIQVD